VNVLYTTAARATGGRDGQAGTLDGNFSVKLATPKELGGAGGEGSNPEQLFASGYALTCEWSPPAGLQAIGWRWSVSGCEMNKP
jgi:hypothetical protein